MPTPMELLAQAASSTLTPLSSAPPPVPANSAFSLLAQVANTKKQEVVLKSDQKKTEVANNKFAMPSSQDFYQMAAGRASQTGVQSRSEVENDLATLTEVQIHQKYGDAAPNLLFGNAAGINAYTKDTAGYRTMENTLSDSVSGIGSGLANAVGGIGAMGAGLLNNEAGAWASGQLADMNEAIQGTQSRDLNARRRALAARTAMTSRDNTQLFEQESKTEGETVAGLRRIGRDLKDSFMQAADGTSTMGDGISQGIGSLLVAGPLGKVVSGTARALGATETTATSLLGSRVGSWVAENGGTAAGIGLMEGGGAYQQATDSIMNKSHDDLMKNSPMYRELIEADVGQAEAKSTVANRTGLLAASIQGPISAVTGALVAKFEGAPLTVPTLRKIGRNLLREKFEEGVQSGSGQLSQNFASKLLADSTQQISEGVGEQAGVGALYGLGTAAAIQAPSAAAAVGRGAGTAVLGAVDGALGALDTRIEALKAENKANAPVNDAVVQQAAAAVAETAPVAAETLKAAIDQAETTPEAREVGKAYADELVKSTTFSVDELDEAETAPFVREMLADAPDRLAALNRLAAMVEELPAGSQEQLSSGLLLQNMLTRFVATANRAPEALDSMPADHEGARIYAKLGEFVSTVQSNPTIVKTMQTIQQMVAKATAAQEAAPVQVTEESLATPQGQLAAQNTIELAAAAPDKANLETVKSIRFHATQGRMKLSARQMAILDATQAVLEAAQYQAAAKAAAGIERNIDVVSGQVLTNRDDKKAASTTKQSATQHTQAVLAAYNAGDRDLARDALASFGEFVKHMSNKVGAINDHFASGQHKTKGLPYLQLREDRTWQMSDNLVGVNPFSADSVQFAQTVGIEAQTLADVFNGLVEALPDLGVSHVEPTSLNSLLTGAPFREVGEDFVKGRRRQPGKGTNKAGRSGNATRGGQLDTGPAASITPAGPDAAEAARIEKEKADAAAKAKLVAETAEKEKAEQEKIRKAKEEADAAKAKADADAAAALVNDGTFSPKNEEQRLGIQKIQDFLDDKAGGDMFVLEGKAGTGKTTIMQEALRKVLAAGKSVTIAAVSHKAKAVLEGKLKTFSENNKFNSGLVEARSVAGLLGLKPDPENNGKFVRDPYARFAPPIEEVSILVVDEASMLDAETLALIMGMKPKTAKVIFLGDIGQLAPVLDGEQSAKLKAQGKSEISPVFTAEVPKHRLLERVRQGEDSSILPYADNYWNNSQIDSPKGNPVPVEQRVNSPEMSFFASTGPMLTKYIDLFKRAVAEKKTTIVKIIAYNNKEGDAKAAPALRQLEGVIRQRLFGDNPAQYETGELVILNDTYPIDETVSLENSREFSVTGAEADTITVRGQTFSIYNVNLLDDVTGEAYTVPALSKEPEVRQQWQTMMNAWSAENKKLPRGSQASKNAWKAFFQAKQMFAQLAYAYVITSHKAQGSTYETSIVLEDNFLSAGMESPANKSRGLYTAITRASKEAVIVSKLNPEQSVTAPVKVKITPAVTGPSQRVLDEEADRAEEDAARDRIDAWARNTPVVTKTVDEDVDLDAANAELNSLNEDEEAAEPVVTKVTKPVRLAVRKKAQPTRDTAPADVERVEPEGKKTGMAFAFPNLFSVPGKLRNFFHEAFKLPRKPTVRVPDALSPIEAIQETLADSDSLADAIGTKNIRGNYTPEIARAYQAILEEASNVGLAMQTNLEAWLAKPHTKSGGTNASFFGSGNEANRWVNGKILNIVEQGVDGNFYYNQQLLEGAVLAGMQWWIRASDYTVEKEDAEISRITGVPLERVTDKLRNQVNEGLSTIEAKRSLAQQIARYWGVEANRDAADGYVEGITESVAAELIQALQDTGNLVNDPLLITEEMGLPPRPLKKPKYDKKGELIVEPIIKNVRMADRYKVAIDIPKALMVMPTLIEKAMMITPEENYYIGGAIPTVARRQRRNPLIENQQQQLDAIDAAQNMPRRLNMPVINLYQALGEKNLQTLFAGGDTSVPMNVNHKVTLDGRNLSVQSAFRDLEALVSQVQNYADGADESQVDIHYAFNMLVNSRLMMLGRNNPQSSKLMREAVMPTFTTLDMVNNQSHRDFFNIALAQALGVKIHYETRADAIAKVQALLAGPLAPAVDSVRKWQVNGGLDGNFTQTVKDTFDKAGVGLTPAAFHALIQHVRLELAGDKTKFDTSAYIEADGVANGPTMAVVMLTFDQFDAHFIKTSARGGMFLANGGRNADGTETTMADQKKKAVDHEDMYEDTQKKLEEFMKELRLNYATDPVITEQMDHLNVLLSAFLPKVTFDADGNLVFNRGVTKNPLTITIYGAGEKGIAGNVVETITDAIYERMSTGLARIADGSAKSSDAALFGGTSANGDTTQVQDEKFWAALNALTNQKMDNVKTDAGYIYQLEPADSGMNRGTGFNSIKTLISEMQEFTFSDKEIENFTTNMQYLFIRPMRKAIEQTVGKKVMISSRTIQKATQVQSILAEAMFKRLVAERLIQKEKDPLFRKGDFLSKNEQQELLELVLAEHPPIEMGTQKFWISGKQSADVGSSSFGSALDEKMKTDGFVYGPGKVGVSGIAMMVIGPGDGQIIQNALTMPDAPTKAEMIYDGVHLPLDTVEADSRKVNEAVYQTWTNSNPLKALGVSFAKSLEGSTAAAPFDLPTKTALVDVFYPPNERKVDKISDAALRIRMKQLAATVTKSGLSVEARQNVLKRVSFGTDQLAGAAAPFNNNTSVVLTGTDEEIAAQLNELYDIELARLTNAPKPKANISEELEALGVESSTGARVLSPEAIAELGKSVNMPESQRVIFDQVRKSGAADGYTVVFGTLAQVRAHAKLKGAVMPADAVFQDAGRDIRGFTVHDDKTIYLVSPTTETLVHELVHAAVTAKIDAYYAGEKLDPTVTDSIQRLQLMMEGFRGMEGNLGNVTPEIQEAYDQAVAQIDAIASDDSLSPQARQSAMLDEFIAWATTNQKLVQLLKRVEVNPIVKLAQDVIAMIKKLIWGKRSAPEVGDDFFSNLQFHTSVLIRAQPTLSARLAAGYRFQSGSYGSSDRLTQVRESFGRRIGMHLKEKVDPKIAANRRNEVRRGGVIASAISGSVAAHGFPMTAQESTAFQTVVLALATTAELDGNALSSAQEMYTHVTKYMTDPKNGGATLFMDNPTSTDPNELYQAQERYNVIMGNYMTEIDGKGRSTLLPVFLGLAITNDRMRKMLVQVPIPKAKLNPWETMDGALENVGNIAMDKLGAAMSGVKKNAPNVEVAIDQLTQRLADVAQDDAMVFEQFTNPVGNFIDTSNDFVVDKIATTADKVIAATDRVLTSTSSNKVTRAIARSAQLFAKMATEKNGKVVAEGFMSDMNRLKGFEPLHSLMKDLVGRTVSNAKIFDLIKVFRARIQQQRQNYRENAPSVIASKFSRQLTDQEWTALHNGMAKTDLASLVQGFTVEEIVELAGSTVQTTRAITRLELAVKQADPANWVAVQKKAKQLANFMNTGKPGISLLRNASAVAHMMGEGLTNRAAPSVKTITDLDQLISLYALKELNADHKAALVSLVQDEPDGLAFALNYLRGQREEELRKADISPLAAVNAYKGYIPSMQQDGVSLIVALDSEYPELMEQSYVRVAPYVGSGLEMGGPKRSYYFASVNAKAAFKQGLFQNIRQTAYGVEVATGYTTSMTAGRITDPRTVARITRLLKSEFGNENLLPVRDENGVAVAYERSIDPEQLLRLNGSTHMAKMIGVWRGRQAEEADVQQYNSMLIQNLKETYDEDMIRGSSKRAEYVNLFDPKEVGNDQVRIDAVRLLTPETREEIKNVFGNEFLVRRDMLDDAFGFRDASVGDMWTGNSRWSAATQERVKRLAIGAFGNEAYRKLVNAEGMIQNYVQNARILIVVKSVVVPMANLVSNVYQLIARGVPMTTIIRDMPRKTAEIQTYVKTKLRLVEAEAELRAATGNVRLERALTNEMQSIQDNHRRLSIWPLIEAGEFSAISDVGISRDDILLSDGELHAYMERLAGKLPGDLKTAGRYALVTKDTALFQGLQKSMEYGDFLAKALLYDDLVKRKKKTPQEALNQVTEEYVHYDRLPGRFRGYMESMGLMMFYAYKIRSAKVAMSIMRNNPVHALLSMNLPAPAGVDLPTSANIFTKIAGGTLGNSLGPGQVLHAPMLNPWWQAMN